MCVIKLTMAKRVCLKCEKGIETTKDHYVLLGTYRDDQTMDESYFHIQCWMRYFEEKTRQKAEVVIKGYTEKMMPIAKQLSEKLKDAIGQREDSEDHFEIKN